MNRLVLSSAGTLFKRDCSSPVLFARLGIGCSSRTGSARPPTTVHLEEPHSKRICGRRCAGRQSYPPLDLKRRCLSPAVALVRAAP
jgi:hypothetical protein